MRKSNCVSVVVTAYNCGARIAPTLESVFAQTLNPSEVIVVDDGSTDETFQWIETHYTTRLRLIHQENAGVAKARNRGLQEVTGDFVAFLDHDDIWMPEKLELQLQKMLSSPRLGVVYCSWNRVSSSDGEILENGKTRLANPLIRWPEGRVFGALLKNNIIIYVSVPLIKTQKLRDIGGFDSLTVPSDDWDLWLRLAKKTEFGFVPEVLLNYMHSQGQQSTDANKMRISKNRIFWKHKFSLPLHPKAVFVYATTNYFSQTIHPFYNQIRLHISAGEWSLARGLLWKTWKKFPFLFLCPQWVYAALRIFRRDNRVF